MGLLKRKNKKADNDIELTQEELDNVTAGVPRHNDWCPKVDVSAKKYDELTEEELDEIKAGIPKTEIER